MDKALGAKVTDGLETDADLDRHFAMRRADGFALRPVEHALCRGVEHHNALAFVDGHDRVHCGIDNAAQSRFASDEQRFGPNALGDVAQNNSEDLGPVFDVL